MTKKIDVFSKWGDVRRQAARNGGMGMSAPVGGNGHGEMPHGLTAAEIERLHERFDSFLPQISSKTGSVNSFFEGLLPENASLAPNAGAGLQAALRKRGHGPGGISHSNAGGHGGNFTTTPTPYLPEFASADRQSYPIHHVLANRYWRLFYKLDPVIGTCIDLFSELVFGDFQLSGEGVDGEIKDQLEHMCEVTQLKAVLPQLVREFMVLGEVGVHTFFDDDKGIWTHIALHNPDQLEVIHAPFMNMEPYVEFVPDDRLRQVLMADNIIVQQLRESMPPDLLSRLLAHENIALSPVNFTFIPRKQHFYDTRGTSIISRMWRTLMYEDAIMQASLQTARRAAGPLKIAKIGNAATGWIPSPDHEQRLLELIAQAELDPMAWICFVAGTPVVLEDGTHKPIEEIKVGDKVLDANGDVQTVERAWCEGTPTEITEIELIGGTIIHATHAHRWPAWIWPRTCACGCDKEVKIGSAFASGHNKKYEQNYLVPAFEHDRIVAESGKTTFTRKLPSDWNPYCDLRSDELRVGDYLLTPRTFKEKLPDGITDTHARLLGYYVAEGHTGTHYINYSTEPTGEVWTATWSFGYHEETTWVKEVVDLCATLGIVATTYVADSYARVSFQRGEYAHFAGWLKTHGGQYATEKRLSKDVMSWPLSLKEELIRGMYRGDGCQSLSHNQTPNGAPQIFVQYATSSFDLACQLRIILTQLGYGSAIRETVRNECFQGHELLTLPTKGVPGVCAHGHSRAVEYAVQSLGEDARRLADLIWLDRSISEEGKAKHRKRRPCYQTTDDHLFNEIVELHTIPNDKPVYNLSVSGSHTYQVHNISTRNCYHYAVEFELVGVQERVLKIDTQFELIERAKLIALGISQSFLTGEVTYAASAAGLTVFLRRLRNLRESFEAKWLYPKFFRQVAEMNKWVKPTEAELAHKVRIRRSHKELVEDARYIIPKMEWDRSLDPSVDSEMINAMQSLSQLGVRFSKTTIMSQVNRDFETETKQVIKDAELEARLLKDHPELAVPGGAGGEAAGGGGGGGAMPAAPPAVLPGIPPENFEGFGGPGGGEEGGGAGPGEPGGGPAAPGAPGGAAPPAPAGASLKAAEGDEDDNAPSTTTWAKSLVDDLRSMIDGYEPDEELWQDFLDVPDAKTALDTGDADLIWDLIEDYLADRDYPTKEIKELGKVLKQRRAKKIRAQAPVLDDLSNDDTFFSGV